MHGLFPDREEPQLHCTAGLGMQQCFCIVATISRQRQRVHGIRDKQQKRQNYLSPRCQNGVAPTPTVHIKRQDNKQYLVGLKSLFRCRGNCSTCPALLDCTVLLSVEGCGCVALYCTIQYTVKFAILKNKNRS